MLHFCVLQPVALSFIQALRNPTFQQDNARPHVTGIVQTFLDTENARLFPLPTRSPDLSPIENVWSMVAEWLARHHTPVTTVHERWHCVETAWASVPVHAIQSLIQCPGVELLLLLPEGVVLGTKFSGSKHPNFLKI
ncbi:uncharacterized protein TNCV_1569611 [Trichonephila clavipes]|uniref:Tc1-like transposase DDE domain-containing protein n=1 Tax=Trichonephila clavipes TaxID=2585209 RepID=A0A8X6SKL9_TRICX|nr:uncharacterized protein TNCV_1569611 [Trichonephila clavipes]